MEKRAIISEECTPESSPSQACKKASAGKPTVDELADDSATRLSDAAADLL